MAHQYHHRVDNTTTTNAVKVRFLAVCNDWLIERYLEQEKPPIWHPYDLVKGAFGVKEWLQNLVINAHLYFFTSLDGCKHTERLSKLDGCRIHFWHSS